MTLLDLGVLATSGKENEHRLPIHPRHFERIDPDLRARMLVETGYGRRFGVSDAELAALVGALRPRAEVIAASEVVLLPKPTLADIAELRHGQTLWGWPHTVQDTGLTQLSIDKGLTLIAWEAMNHWTEAGGFGLHVFHMNNELAGYASVMHAMSLVGSTGSYGRPLTGVVIGFGNAARGAVTALRALGVHDVTVLTFRELVAVASPMPAATLEHLDLLDDEPGRTTVMTPEGPVPTAEYLARYDIVVNCVLQDTDAPLMFVRNDELAAFAPGALLVDVSCDAGMGFECAVPTTFVEPIIAVGEGVSYYGVDHSPGYLWNSATWVISEALLPYLRTVMSGPEAWESDPTVSRAIEIQDGVIRNPRILSFQRRGADHPHPVDTTP